MPRASRWFVLAAFALLVSATQILWLTFAPIARQSHDALGVSEGAVGDLAIINPLVFVLLAIPAGRWLDRWFSTALAAGALLTAIGAVLRMVDTSSYATIFVGQLVMSLGQPFVLNASTKVAARYFPPLERTAAISVASAAQFGGILVAALTGGALVDAGGLGLVLHLQAGFAVTAAAAVLVAGRVPASYALGATGETSLRWLRRDPLMLRLAGLLFIGVGVFNAVATWLDTILVDLGHPGAAGTLLAVMTISGVGGAVVLPGLAARRGRRRALLLTTTLISAVAFLAIALALAVVPGVLLVAVLLALVGFVLLSGLPVALDWSELQSGPDRAGTATGFLLLAGNLGGVVLVLVVQAALGNPYLALATMSVVVMPGLLLAPGCPGMSCPTSTTTAAGRKSWLRQRQCHDDRWQRTPGPAWCQADQARRAPCRLRYERAAGSAIRSGAPNNRTRRTLVAVDMRRSAPSPQSTCLREATSRHSTRLELGSKRRSMSRRGELNRRASTRGDVPPGGAADLLTWESVSVGPKRVESARDELELDRFRLRIRRSSSGVGAHTARRQPGSRVDASRPPASRTRSAKSPQIVPKSHAVSSIYKRLGIGVCAGQARSSATASISHQDPEIPRILPLVLLEAAVRPGQSPDWRSLSPLSPQDGLRQLGDRVAGPVLCRGPRV